MTDEAGGEVVRFHPREDSPNGFRELAAADTAARLRRYADMADAGEIVGTVIAVVYADGRIGAAYSPSDDPARQLGAVTLAKHEYARHVIEDLGG